MIFQMATSKPTVPLGRNIVVSCGHYDRPKEEGATIVSVSGGALMSGLCATCWVAITAMITCPSCIEQHAAHSQGTDGEQDGVS